MAQTCTASYSVFSGSCASFSFTDASTASGNIISWTYDFGDGGTSSDPNPTHTYYANGSYVVCFYVQTDDDCFNIRCDTFLITCIPPPACQALFSTSINDCQVLSFTDESTTNPGTITDWFYDFGDGQTSTLQNTTHAYGSPGTYLACLTVTSSDAQTSTFCDTLFLDTILPISSKLWLGATSADWNTNSNWCAGTVPLATDNVAINAIGIQPHVTADPSTPVICADLKVLSGATLTVDAGKALTVNGALTNHGTMLIKADVTGIGSLLTNGAVSGSGSFKMEQYLTGAGGATPNGVFYYISTPVEGATTATYDLASGNKIWIAAESTQSYTQLTGGPYAMYSTTGYVVRMGATGTVTFSGTKFHSGGYATAELTHTGTTANSGYNLIGNPYPSTIDWEAVSDLNLETSVWFKTHVGASMTFDTYNTQSHIGTNNNGNGSVTKYIPPTQAFWVRASTEGFSAQPEFSNAIRNHGSLASIYKIATEEGTLRMTLSNGTVSDEAIVLFNSDAQDGFDAYDSHKFWASNIPQLYMNVLEDTLVINGLSSIANNPVVDLGMKLPEVGNYNLNATSITIIGESVYLEDRMLGFFQDLNAQPTYAFSSSVAGNIPTRFALHFGMAVTGIEDGEVMKSRVYTSNVNQLNIILSENTEKGSVEVLDMTGRVVFVSSLNTNRNTLDMNVNTGVYLIRVDTEKGTDIHRVLFN